VKLLSDRQQWNMCMWCAISGSGDVTPVTESQSQLNTSSHSTPHGVLKTATQRSGRRSTLETRSKTTPPSGACTTTTLVDISGDNVDDDDDDVTVTKFGRLKVGFTPGVDGKSRRVRASAVSQYCKGSGFI